MLDGRIANPTVIYVYAFSYAIVANWLFLRRHPRPPRSRYRKDGRTPWVAFWNVFDNEVFTPEAIGYHRAIFRSIPVLLGAFVLGWLALDAVW